MVALPRKRHGKSGAKTHSLPSRAACEAGALGAGTEVLVLWGQDRHPMAQRSGPNGPSGRQPVYSFGIAAPAQHRTWERVGSGDEAEQDARATGVFGGRGSQGSGWGLSGLQVTPRGAWCWDLGGGQWHGEERQARRTAPWGLAESLQGRAVPSVTC